MEFILICTLKKARYHADIVRSIQIWFLGCDMRLNEELHKITGISGSNKSISYLFIFLWTESRVVSKILPYIIT